MRCVITLVVLGVIICSKLASAATCCPSSSASSDCTCPGLNCCSVSYDGLDYKVPATATMRCSPQNYCPEYDVCIFSGEYEYCKVYAPWCIPLDCISCIYVTGCMTLTNMTTDCSAVYGFPPTDCTCPGTGCVAVGREACSPGQVRTTLPTVLNCI